MAEYPGAIAFARFKSTNDPLVEGFEEGSNDRPAAGQLACPRTWGVTEITLASGDKTSKSFSARDHDPVAAGLEADGRFWFAPLKDDVVVAWKLKNPDNAETVTLELFRTGSGAPIWSRTIAREGAVAGRLADAWKGGFPEGEWTAPDDFPHHVVTVEHSPYMLKIRASGSAEAGFVERWTYFDVLVHGVKLLWGPPELRPPGDRADVTALYRNDTDAAELALIVELADQRVDSGAIDDAARHELKLPCDQFTQTSSEMADDTLFARHKDQWGHGPRLPLLAKITLRTAAGEAAGGATVAPAIGKAPFLWDWESEDQIATLAADYTSAPVRTFLGDTLDYKRTDGTCPPGSTNCHEDHGGKRGPTTTVFPAQADAGAFPFAVTRCTTRPWASTSLAALTGAHAGFTGVLFQPSRIARDTYKVTVYLAAERGGARPALDCADDAATLRQDHPKLPRASSGVFEVTRLIHCAYIRKADAVEAADVTASTAEYLKAGVHLDWLAGNALTTEQDRLRDGYNGWIDTVLSSNGRLVNPTTGFADVNHKRDALNLIRPMAYAFDGINQFNGGTGAGVAASFVAWEWAVFRERHLLDSIREFVLNKPRKINTPKKQYNAWRTTNGLLADDSAFLLPFYNNLSATRRAKVNLILAAKLNNLPKDAPAYKGKLKTVCQQMLKVVSQQFLIGSIGARMTCVHSVDTFAFKQRNGAVVDSHTDVGGFAPSDANIHGGRRSVNLIFIPTTVSLARQNDPNTYHVPAAPIIKHEIGHNFFLVHAPAAPDADRPAPEFKANCHDRADLRCLMNYDTRSDHLCGFCNLRLRGWATRVSGALVALSNDGAANKNP